MGRATYLDYNATAPVRPQAAAAVAEALDACGNASSVHGFGRAARRIVEAAREAVAALVGADPAGVVFTGGGTEANNQAIAGGGRTVVSAIEHESVLAAAPGARRVSVNAAGVVDLDDLEDALAGRPALVSVMLANNETGVIQPLAEASALAHAAGALVHCDAVQGAGKIPVDMGALGIDLMTLSAHKLGGPQGVGALVVSDYLELQPLLRGGGQERRRRAGTENVPGIAGFGVAARLAKENLTVEARRLTELRDRLEAGVTVIAPDCIIHGGAAPRLPNTACIGLAGVKGEVQVMALDLAGVAVSSGAACSSGKVTPSHVLGAMGAANDDCAIRVSLGWASEVAHVDHLLAAYRQMLAGVVAAA